MDANQRKAMQGIIKETLSNLEENGFEMGYLFSVIRYTPVQYEQEYLASQGGFGGLDIFARESLTQALTAYEGTLVMVTHDRENVEKYSDIVLRLEKGRLIEEYKREKGLRTDKSVADMLQNIFEGITPVINKTAGGSEYSDELLKVIKDLCNVKESEIRINDVYKNTREYAELMSALHDTEDNYAGI